MLIYADIGRYRQIWADIDGTAACRFPVPPGSSAESNGVHVVGAGFGCSGVDAMRSGRRPFRTLPEAHRRPVLLYVFDWRYSG